MRGNYLIPANSKKSELILGLFTTMDAILFGSGVSLTVLLLIILITGFLVFPVPNYHNILQLIINIYTFYFVRQRRYKWRGWCYKDGNNK